MGSRAGLRELFFLAATAPLSRTQIVATHTRRRTVRRPGPSRIADAGPAVDGKPESRRSAVFTRVLTSNRSLTVAARLRHCPSRRAASVSERFRFDGDTPLVGNRVCVDNLCSLTSGAPINVVSGPNPSGSANINGVALTTTPSTVGTLGGFSSYTVPSIRITSGDFVAGLWVPNPPNAYPMAEDTQPLSKQHSYISTDGIRCIVDVGQRG